MVPGGDGVKVLFGIFVATLLTIGLIIWVPAMIECSAQQGQLIQSVFGLPICIN